MMNTWNVQCDKISINHLGFGGNFDPITKLAPTYKGGSRLEIWFEWPTPVTL